MYSLILQLLLFSSLGTIILLLARALPRVSDESGVVHPESFFDRLLRRLPLEKVDTFLNGVFEKLLRKLKVGVLKIDNVVSGYLARLRRTNNTSNAGKDFFGNDNESGEKPN